MQFGECCHENMKIGKCMKKLYLEAAAAAARHIKKEYDFLKRSVFVLFLKDPKCLATIKRWYLRLGKRNIQS